MVEVMKISLEELENAEVVTEREKKLIDGTKVYVNSNGEPSGRLLTYPLSKIHRNRFMKVLNPRENRIYGWINLIRKYGVKMGKDVAINQFEISINDYKTGWSYYIPFNIGAFFKMNQLRDKLCVSSGIDSRELYFRFMEKDVDKLTITPVYLALYKGELTNINLIKTEGRRVGRKVA